MRLRRRTVVLSAAALLALAPGYACARRTPDAGLSQQERIYRARDRVLPALVHIQPVLEVFRQGERGKVAVTGSGVIFSPDGYILTNTHVVGRAQRLSCTLFNHAELEARLIGIDPLSDLAVIRVDMSSAGEGVHHAPLGDSSRLQAGQVVLAMGSPLGLARSISLGVISSLDRYFPASELPGGAITGALNTWIQTDAAINPGNSGGPLVDLGGNVIGINARAIPVFGENLGFAIPINLAREVAAALIAGGEISRAWIGVTFQQIRGLGSHFGVTEDRGAVVGSVARGSPAEQAGLTPGDVITDINGSSVVALFEEDLPRLQKMIADLPIGQAVSMTYMRDGSRGDASLVTRARPDADVAEFECREWGFTVSDITLEMRRQLRLPGDKGVRVTGVKDNSFAEEAGLRPGDVIVRLEGRELSDLNSYKDLYREMVTSRRGALLAEVRRGRLLNFFVIKPTYDAQNGRTPPPGSP